MAFLTFKPKKNKTTFMPLFFFFYFNVIVKLVNVPNNVACHRVCRMCTVYRHSPRKQDTTQSGAESKDTFFRECSHHQHTPFFFFYFYVVAASFFRVLNIKRRTETSRGRQTNSSAPESNLSPRFHSVLTPTNNQRR